MGWGLEYWVVFLQGLAVSAHCVGMCGGFVIAYSSDLAVAGRGRMRRLLTAHGLFNFGRLMTFSAFGFLAGWLGSVADLAAGARGLQGAVAALAGGLMIFLGLGRAGVFPGLTWERESLIAERSWFRAAMVSALRSKSALRPWLIGLMVGFLPCGALWTILLWAAAAGSGPRGAGMLAAYALGTTPALFGVGMFTLWLGKLGRERLNRVAGVLLALMGGWALYRGISGGTLF